VFGRDALLTSLQLLAVNPGLALETLETLAGLQGSRQDPWRDEEPGKIVHEVRRGELAGAGVIPQTRYYGTVDATPLFVLLFAMHFEWTADRRFAERLLPNVTAALEWIDRHGDIDGDGFVEYLCRSPLGSANQGWKDSPDSVVHTDGRQAVGPIALSEVQGYAYMAKVRVAGVFEALGDRTAAARLRAEAVALRRRFDAAFWMEDEGCFAMALDGDKRQVRTVTSNPGHCLYSGIVEDDKAELLARRLVQPDMFSGWGIRTMSATAAAYNPMSYHNGSVWPHDTALIAAGLYRSGFVEPADRVAAALFDAASHSRDLRLPELFGGFSRRAAGGPVAYPTACAPQAWAAGAPFLILQAMLGISARADRETITIARPHLPSWLRTVELADLRVGPSRLSLVFRRHGETTSCSVAGRHGDVEVVVKD
jgi:glycogen debranching enzyme